MYDKIRIPISHYLNNNINDFMRAPRFRPIAGVPTPSLTPEQETYYAELDRQEREEEEQEEQRRMQQQAEGVRNQALFVLDAVKEHPVLQAIMKQTRESEYDRLVRIVAPAVIAQCNDDVPAIVIAARISHICKELEALKVPPVSVSSDE